jgi:hypothetical protein
MNKDVQALIYGSSLLSIVAAIYIFVSGKRDLGIFVGLWAPTILSLGVFFNTERPPFKTDSAQPGEKA